MKRLFALILVIGLAGCFGGGSDSADGGNTGGDVIGEDGGTPGVDTTTPGDDAAVPGEDTPYTPGEDAADKPDTPANCNCNGAVCGVDNCGNSCGTCPGGQVCNGGQCVAQGACDVTGFLPANEVVDYDQAKEYLFYQGQTAEPAPVDLMIVESYQNPQFGGPTQPGTYDLAGSNYEDCGLCVLGATGCTENGCQKVFLADEGTVEILSIGGEGVPFKAVMHNVKLKEVTIDPNTYKSTPVQHGQVWCMDGYSFDETVPEKNTQNECIAQGNGNSLNNNIADFSLQNCNGETVNLHDYCGQVKALWIAAVAGWCGACSQWVPQMATAQADYNSIGLQVMVVLGENASGGKPTLTYCNQYANSHGIDPSLVFIDHDGQYSWAKLFYNINTYSGGTISLPWNVVLRGSNMEYYWSDTAGSGDINAALSALLN